MKNITKIFLGLIAIIGVVVFASAINSNPTTSTASLPSHQVLESNTVTPTNSQEVSSPSEVLQQDITQTPSQPTVEDTSKVTTPIVNGDDLSNNNTYTNVGVNTPEKQQANCHPSYSGNCLNPNASDYDCAGGSGNGPYYTGKVRVIGPDVFGLDRDHDGWGCE